MKNKTLLKTIILLSIFLFSVTYVSASETVFYNQDSGDDIIYKEQISKNYYDSDDDYVITRKITAYYDNKDRYSTYDYRHGYSYRNTRDYWERHHDYYDVEDVKIIRTDEDYWYKQNLKKERDYDKKKLIIYKAKSYDDYYDYRDYRYDYDYYDHHDNRYYDDWHYYDTPRTQKRYIPYLKKWETRECYDHAPRGSLFYMRC